MRRATILVLSALLLTATAGDAQESPAAAQALRPFDLWVGEWTGSGWSVSVTGKRTEFTLVETVQRKAGGSVLLVEGRGRSREDGSLTHDGVALVYYDAKTKRYHWHGHDAKAGLVDSEPKLVAGGFEWSIAVDQRGTRVRFTILLDERRWLEVGEVSGDGKSWTRFMEMTLERQ